MIIKELKKGFLEFIKPKVLSKKDYQIVNEIIAKILEGKIKYNGNYITEAGENLNILISNTLAAIRGEDGPNMPWNRYVVFHFLYLETVSLPSIDLVGDAFCRG